MEQQGATARLYANMQTTEEREENSQAEATANEGAVGFVRPPNNNNNNPHYENIYESLEQFAAADAVAPAALVAPQPAVVAQQQQQAHPVHQQASPRLEGSIRPPRTYRNDIYDRNFGCYDVPRANPRASGNVRRANLHLDLNRPRYSSVNRQNRQRSFDDTESAHYNHLPNNYCRYENIYEQIHEEPIYRNIPHSSAGQVYGRLGVIGHGVGRIERHLSSSCGNIDHYNLGGHYAVLGHSHLGTVGHIRFNANPGMPSTNPGGSNKICNTTGRDGNVKSSYSSFFNCLSKENSQSMTNITRSEAQNMLNNAAAAVGPSAPSQPEQNRGAIPKSSKPKPSVQNNNPPTSNSSTLNRMSKTSLQWLLMNKWLPLWVGQDADCKIIDFNFMFSRNCEKCGDNPNHQQELVRFNGELYDNPDAIRNYVRPQFASPNPQNRIFSRSSDYHSLLRREASLPVPDMLRNYDIPRLNQSPRDQFLRARSESPRLAGRSATMNNNDPFRNWELNSECNSFKPANNRVQDVRRITDGTYRAKDLKEQKLTTRPPTSSSLATTSSHAKIKILPKSTPEPTPEPMNDDQASSSSSSTQSNISPVLSGVNPPDEAIFKTETMEVDDLVLEEESQAPSVQDVGLKPQDDEDLSLE